jgi:hypothetical protein
MFKTEKQWSAVLVILISVIVSDFVLRISDFQLPRKSQINLHLKL